MAALVARFKDTQHDPADLPRELDAPPSKISAYYSLVFPNFTYYLQTLNVTIGRRCIPSSASSSDNPHVDVDLGPLKSVSRLHAKIEYEEDEERFVLIVIGRNGAWVDGVWSGSGSKVPLSDRSQIQIASRTFHFILPPPPAPEDSPSPTSDSSDNRARSRSASVDIVDVTSISPPSSIPSCSPPLAPVSSPRSAPPKIPPLPGSSLPNSNTISKFKSSAKKRKKSDSSATAPLPELMPPKPPLTYAQLCYRAIKALGGKGSLQEICNWIRETYDWYKYCAKDWESSVRHNLSSNPGFKKLLRTKEEKGKGALWLIDEAFEHNFEEQDARRQASLASGGTGGKDGRPGSKKAKAVPLDPPFTRSVKGDLKGAPLPPPLTSTPLTLKTTSITDAPTPSFQPMAPLHPSSIAPTVKLETAAATVPPFAPQTPSASSGMATAFSFATIAGTPAPATINTSAAPASTSSHPLIPATVRIPIVVGPAPNQVSTSSGPPKPIVLHDNSLILNPEIFSHLTPEHLRDLEALGAQKALEILQSYIVRYYKEKLKAEGGRGRGRGRPRRGRGAPPGTGRDVPPAAAPSRTDISPSGLFTTTPLTPRIAQPSSSSPVAEPQAAMQVDSTADPASTTAPVPPPIDSLQMPVESAPSPIVVIDDDPPESDDRPAAKKRRLEDGPEDAYVPHDGGM
ncbi:uncharacterized protein LAESUDRAFT_733482 [Laetiporus sulphureus 93-53]|uniref:FHA domain-containing protein n=1 Tax=Laetiporus sulphureus 93-53 TaxID=1314785 RepID=A0A165ID12_9APHY|nr:uncharacterized protein LAESUDRAFT_733482 [Laetiporus sulphureus 93-53]KZT12911.1 hypothetical protein LAESUDRAFT_733482 [Laetiporus sulphureus 93-53]